MDLLDIILPWGGLVITLGAFGSAFFLLLGKKCTRRQGAVCAAFICAYTGMVFWDAANTPEVEWNPLDLKDEEIVGTWSDGRETMVLAANGVFNYRLSEATSTGTWTRDDWNLYLNANRHGRVMRFVRHQGQCRLMTNLPDDLDAWNRRYLGLARVKGPEPAGRTVETP